MSVGRPPGIKKPGGGTHPNGMLSCLDIILHKTKINIYLFDTPFFICFGNVKCYVAN